MKKLKKPRKQLTEKQKDLYDHILQNDEKGGQFMDWKELCQVSGYGSRQSIDQAINSLVKNEFVSKIKKEGSKKTFITQNKNPKKNKRKKYEKPLTKKQRGLIDFLAHNDKNGSPYVTHEKIGEVTGYGIRQNVKSAMFALMERGLIVSGQASVGDKRKLRYALAENAGNLRPTIQDEKIVGKFDIVKTLEKRNEILEAELKGIQPINSIVRSEYGTKHKKDGSIISEKPTESPAEIESKPLVGKFDLIKTLESRNEILQADLKELKENRDFLLDENQKLSSVRQSRKGSDDIPKIIEEYKSRIKSLEIDKERLYESNAKRNFLLDERMEENQRLRNELLTQESINSLLMKSLVDLTAKLKEGRGLLSRLFKGKDSA